MAFGNYTYPNYYNPAPMYGNMQQQNQVMPVQQQQSNSGIIWVQGEAGAKAYPVAPGASVLLMDSEAKTMYLKGADQSGIPYMRIFDYTERMQNQQAEENITPKFVTQEEFLKLAKAVKAIKERMEGANNEQSDI